MNTLKNLRRLLNDKGVKVVFIWVNYNSDDGLYIRTSKAAVWEAFDGHPADTRVDIGIRADEPDAVYIN